MMGKGGGGGLGECFSNISTFNQAEESWQEENDASSLWASLSYRSTEEKGSTRQSLEAHLPWRIKTWLGSFLGHWENIRSHFPPSPQSLSNRQFERKGWFLNILPVYWRQPFLPTKIYLLSSSQQPKKKKKKNPKSTWRCVMGSS